MTFFQRKVALRVLGIHAGVILFFVIISGMKGCFRPKPKPEIVTFIEFGQAAPPVAVQQVEQMADPKPEPAPQPEPEPAPEPEPVTKPIPKPEPKPTIKPKPKPKTETPKPKPKPEEPKWKPTPVDKIKVSDKRIEPAKPAVDPSEITKALKSVQSNEKLPTTSGPVGNPDADAAYIAQIGRYFDQRWNEPGNASPAASVIYRIYISQWGTITKRTKLQGSGDAAFDASVKTAVNSVSTAPKPPSGFPYEYVEVEFRIRN